MSSTLGYGFLEKVYENALGWELSKRGLHVEQQHAAHVHYDGKIVGDYVPDLIVEKRIIVEIKAIAALETAHRLQCLNHLRATRQSLCLLLNFGRPHLEVARIVWHF